MTESERLARLEERIDAMRESTKVAKTEVDRRLDEMNELRRQIDSERGSYVSTLRYEERHEDLTRRIGMMENTVSRMEGGSAIKASTIGWVLAGAGLLVSIVVVLANLLTN